jgi:hypothetical protein
MRAALIKNFHAHYENRLIKSTEKLESIRACHSRSVSNYPFSRIQRVPWFPQPKSRRLEFNKSSA